MKRLQKIGAGCLGLLLAAGIGLWAARDLPRRALAAVLADRLGAQVHVDRLEILAADRFRLWGLSISHPRDLPALETLAVDQLMVESPLRDLLASRFRRMRFRGVQVRLVPAPAPRPADRPLPAIDEVVLEPATIRLAAGPGSEDFRLCLDAVLRDVGGEMHGEARLAAPALELRPLYGLAGAEAPPGLDAHVEDLRARLTFDGADVEGGAEARAATLGVERGRVEASLLRLEAVKTGPVTRWRLAADEAATVLDDRRAALDAPSVEATVAAASDGALRLELVPRLEWLAEGRLEADWDPAAGTLSSVEARLRGLDLGRLLPGAGIEATADADLRRAGDRLDMRLEIIPTDLVLGRDRELRAMRGATVRIRASTPFEPLTRFQAPASGTLDASFDLPAARGRWGSSTLPPAALPLAATIEGEWQDGETRTFTGNYRLASAAGRLSAEGELSADGDEPRADLTWTLSGIDLERLARMIEAAGLTLPVIELRGAGDARGSLRGPITAGAPAVRGQVTLRRLAAGGKEARLAGGEATAEVSWAGGGSHLELVRMELSGTVETAAAEPLDLTLEASGSIDADLRAGRLEGTLRETPESGSGLGIAHLAGTWRRPADAPAEATVRLDLEGADLARWQRTATPLAEAPELAAYALTGLAGAVLEGSLSGEAWRLAGPIELESAGFTSTDGGRVAEGLAGRWDVAARGAPGAPIEAEGHGRLGGFLLLWNTFFGDFSNVEATADWRASIQPSTDGARPWHLEVDAALPGGPDAAATLDGGGDAWRYTLRLDDPDLAATYGRYLAPLLEERLGQIELGGRLATRVRGSFSPGGEAAAWSLIGGVEVHDLLLESGGGQASVSGLDLDLPLDLRRRAGAEPDWSGPRLAGRLAFERLSVRGLELPPLTTDLAVEADSVGLEKPVALSVLGGTVRLERLTLRHLLRPGRHLESGVELSGIRLERISDALELIPLEGELNGRLAGVRLSPARLSVDGGGEIEVFGGSVRVRDISGENVLSRFPKLTLSADFHDLDLGALTRRLDFGEMTGILEGTLEDCELFRGVPVRFKARLETVHRKGVPRTVDVKAVNNITILGTGQRTNILDRGIQRFFDRYTYERLGVTMRLDRDVLLLRGLERRGDKELFLRGRLPFRIDVVNAQPGKTVSFQTMVGRLRSLDFSSARTER